MRQQHSLALHWVLILSIFVFGCITTGCSSNDEDNSIYDTRNVGGADDENNDPASSDDKGDVSIVYGIDVVQTEADLPECGAAAKGQLFLVVNNSGFQYCDGISYHSLDSLNNPEAGEDGKTSLLAINSESPGDNCPDGGIKIATGIDDNTDGVLDPDEVDDTAFVCNGASGSDGEDGKTAGINMTPEPGGENCYYGGLRIEIGIDDNGDETLDDNEIQESFYICNPPPACDTGRVFDGDMVIDNETDLTTVAGYTAVTGNMTIENLDLTDLVFLSCLTQINGDLIIQNTSLISLEGLHNLTSIGGGLMINANHHLTDLAALDSLQSVQSLAIFENNALTGLGLDALTDVGAVFFIGGNGALCSDLAIELAAQVGLSQENCDYIEILENKCCKSEEQVVEPYTCGASADDQ